MEKKHIITAVGAVFMILFFAISVAAITTSQNPDTTKNSNVPQSSQPTTIENGKQLVRVSMIGSTYFPNPISLTVGMPAVLEVDTSSVTGCYRSISIPAFRVSKTVSPSNNKIEFTPDRTGTFPFSCYMGMGKGQIVVGDGAALPTNNNLTEKDVTEKIACE